MSDSHRCGLCDGDHMTRDCGAADDRRRVLLGKLPLCVTSVRVRGPARLVSGHRAWLVDPGVVAEATLTIEGWECSPQAFEITEDIAKIKDMCRREREKGE